jgi:hypothetical protein
MASSSKIDRATYGPSTIEVFLGAVLSLILGAVLALIYLIAQPVQIGNIPAKGEAASPVVYIKGTQDGDRGKQWLRKKQLFTEGSSVEVNEDELNAWITAGTAPETPKPPGGKKPDKAANDKKPDQTASAGSAGLIQFGTPNFHISNGVFQIGCETEVNLDMLGLKQSLIVQASGRFVKTSDGFSFAADQFYIGCCPLHKLPILGKFVLDRVLANEKAPENLSSAWKKLVDVTVEGDSLKLTIP